MTISESDIIIFYKVSRDQAREYGLKYYYSGPCLLGHDELRYTSNSNCRECQRIKSRDYGRKNIGKIVSNFYNREYGIDERGIKILLAKQNGKCAICKFEFTNVNKREKHVDHNHKTGRIRGILCGNCNTGLGLFKDDIDRLNAAIGYLKDHDHS